MKVAGTSVEIALSKLCGDQDVISPIANIDERTRVELKIRHAQNYGPSRKDIKEFIQWLMNVPTDQITNRQAPKGIVNNHMPLKRIYKKLDKLHPEIRRANIFAIVRSPYEQILSRINHNINFQSYRTNGEAMQATQADLRQELTRHIQKLQNQAIENFRSKNYQIYDSSFDSSIQVKFIRFENLAEELQQTLKDIGIEKELELPFTKKGLKSSNNLFKEIATDEQIKVINQYHKKDFSRFGYDMIN